MRLSVGNRVGYLTAMRQRQTIVLTGFGPFPGMPENVSGRLAKKLASLLQRHFPAHRVVARVLPTEWEPAPEQIAILYGRERPSVALHFGVSERAQGFVIETVARNVCGALPDARGQLPRSRSVITGGPRQLKVRLPVDDILRRLTGLGVPASLSDDAGTYLCNAVLYNALTLAALSERPFAAGFIHIPPWLGAPGPILANSGPALSWETALTGSLEIVRTCLGRPPRARSGEVKAP